MEKRESWITAIITPAFTIIAVPLSLLLWLIGPDETANAREIAAGILVSAVLITPIIYLISLKLQLKKLLSEIESTRQKRTDFRQKHLLGYHGMVHRVRSLFYNYYFDSKTRNYDASAQLNNEIAISVLSDLRDLLKTYFKSIGCDIGEDLAVTLKIRLSRSDLETKFPHLKSTIAEILKNSEWGLLTFARDRYTYQTQRDIREVQTKIYSEEANTAFRRIVNEGWENASYANDDLAASADRNEYQNENKNWKNQYNSTIAVAVRYKSQTGTEDLRHGFLCVDSKNPQKLKLFETKEAFDIVSHAADLLALAVLGILIYSELQISRLLTHTSEQDLDPNSSLGEVDSTQDHEHRSKT